MIRAVLDTDIFVSGLGWGGAPGRVLEAARTGRSITVTSPARLTELASLLACPKLRSALTDADPIGGIRVVTASEFVTLLDRLGGR